MSCVHTVNADIGHFLPCCPPPVMSLYGYGQLAISGSPAEWAISMGRPRSQQISVAPQWMEDGHAVTGSKPRDQPANAGHACRQDCACQSVNDTIHDKSERR